MAEAVISVYIFAYAWIVVVDSHAGGDVVGVTAPQHVYLEGLSSPHFVNLYSQP